jgi:hypothetical protein
MGADRSIPPYAGSGRRAMAAACRRQAEHSMRAALHDAQAQQALGERALVRARRGVALSVSVAAAAGVACALLSWAFWASRDATEAGLIRAAWSLVGATIAGGLVYLALGGIQRAMRRRDAGRRLILRAERQRQRAGAERT